MLLILTSFQKKNHLFFLFDYLQNLIRILYTQVFLIRYRFHYPLFQLNMNLLCQLLSFLLKKINSQLCIYCKLIVIIYYEMNQVLIHFHLVFIIEEMKYWVLICDFFAWKVYNVLEFKVNLQKLLNFFQDYLFKFYHNYDCLLLI